MTRETVRLFLGSFLLTLVLIGGFCGFMMVDLSTDRYMPGDYEPIFLISELGPEGIGLSLMGSSYYLETAGLLRAEDAALRLRGLLPGPVRLAGAAAAKGMEYLGQLLEAAEE